MMLHYCPFIENFIPVLCLHYSIKSNIYYNLKVVSLMISRLDNAYGSLL